MNLVYSSQLRLSSILVLLILINSALNAQWKWINPFPQGNDYNNLAFINDSTGWFIGEKDVILKTTDSGQTFIKQYTGKDIGLNGISFLNHLTGYIIGDSTTLFKTTDGGDTWNEITTPLTPLHYDYTSIFFLNDLEGWITCIWGILSTTNGGQSWTYNDDFWLHDWIGKVFFINSLTGYRTGRFLMKTTDGGNTWLDLYSSGNGLPFASQYQDIYFINDTVGWVYCNMVNEGQIAKTTDGGQNWTIVYQGTWMKNLVFTDSVTAWGISQFGIQLTVDGCKNWTIFPLKEAAICITINSGYAAGKGGIIAKQELHTNVWSRLDHNFLNNAEINDIFFNDPLIGFIAADSGKVLRSTDGGNSWDMKLISDSDLDNLYFTDSASGWLTDRSSIYHTSDGGNTWYKSIDRPELKDIYFHNADTGWAVGWYIKILATKDKGATWSEQGFSLYDLECIFFTDALTGWASGPSVMLKTVDGGEYWGEIPKPTDESILDINFYNQDIGWLVGSHGLIMKTENGGESWTVQHQTPSEYITFYEITVLDSFHVSIIGNTEVAMGGMEGLIYSTKDGGANWSKTHSVTNQIPNSFFLLDRDKGYLGGEGGAFLEFTGESGIPADPSNLHKTATAENSIEISWADNSNNENGFEIRRSDMLSGHYILTGTVGPDITSYTDTGLHPFTAYWYRVRAFNSEGFSASTREISTKTMGILGKPNLINPLDGFEFYTGEITFSWHPVLGASNYRLQVSRDYSFTPIDIDISSITDTLITVKNLISNGGFNWRVAAANQNGTSDWSDIEYFNISILVPGVPQLTYPPNGAIDQPLSIVLSWFQVPNADSYHVQVLPSSDPEVPAFDQAEIPDTSVIVSGLSENTMYNWIVNATNIAGTGDWSYNDFRYFITGSSTSVGTYKYPDIDHITCFPNPFLVTTTFKYELSSPGKVVITIYNMKGELIKLLVNEDLPAGLGLSVWDGSDQTGRQVPGGFYFYKIQTSQSIIINKLCRLK